MKSWLLFEEEDMEEEKVPFDEFGVPFASWRQEASPGPRGPSWSLDKKSQKNTFLIKIFGQQ